jgi:hypothetical protein
VVRDQPPHLESSLSSAALSALPSADYGSTSAPVSHAFWKSVPSIAM